MVVGRRRHWRVVGIGARLRRSSQSWCSSAWCGSSGRRRVVQRVLPNAGQTSQTDDMEVDEAKITPATVAKRPPLPTFGEKNLELLHAAKGDHHRAFSGPGSSASTSLAKCIKSALPNVDDTIVRPTNVQFRVSTREMVMHVGTLAGPSSHQSRQCAICSRPRYHPHPPLLSLPCSRERYLLQSEGRRRLHQGTSGGLPSGLVQRRWT